MDDVKLREYLDLKISSLEQRIDAQGKSLEQKLDAQGELIKQRILFSELVVTRLEGDAKDKSHRLNVVEQSIKKIDSIARYEELIKELDSRINALETALIFNRGKAWTIQAIFLAIPTVLALIAIFKR